MADLFGYGYEFCTFRMTKARIYRKTKTKESEIKIPRTLFECLYIFFENLAPFYRNRRRKLEGLKEVLQGWLQGRKEDPTCTAG